jgi:hypothetical protein
VGDWAYDWPEAPPKQINVGSFFYTPQVITTQLHIVKDFTYTKPLPTPKPSSSEQ